MLLLQELTTSLVEWLSAPVPTWFFILMALLLVFIVDWQVDRLIRSVRRAEPQPHKLPHPVSMHEAEGV